MYIKMKFENIFKFEKMKKNWNNFEFGSENRVEKVWEETKTGNLIQILI